MKYYATINHTHVKYNFATVLLQGKCDLNGHTDVGKRVVGWGNTIHVVVVFAQFFFVQPFDISLVIFSYYFLYNLRYMVLLLCSLLGARSSLTLFL